MAETGTVYVLNKDLPKISFAKPQYIKEIRIKYISNGTGFFYLS